MFSSKSFMFLCLDLYFELFLYMISGRAHNKLWKILKEMGLSDHLTYLLRNLYAVKKQQLEPDTEQQTGSKLGKEYDNAVFFTLFFKLIFRVHCGKMLSWMKHKLESRLEKCQQPQIWGYHSRDRKWRGTKEPLDESKEESEKAGLKQHSKN